MQIDELRNKIFCEDCLIGMQKIPDKSIDCIICDLPYGKLKNWGTCTEWDVAIPFEPLWERYNRIAKDNAAILLFGVEPFTSAIVMSNVKNYRQKLTWLKKSPSNMLNANKMFMNWTEDIVVFYRSLPTFHPLKTDLDTSYHYKHYQTKKGIMMGSFLSKGFTEHTIVGRHPKTVLEFNNNTRTKDRKTYYHPTQKPVDLIRYLIRTYTNLGDIILDNCLGSGTTAIAAMREGRDYIGFEKDEQFFEICERRIQDEKDLMAAQAEPLY